MRRLFSYIRNGYHLALFDSVAVLLWFYIVYRAFVNPLMDWDSWWYHLPISAILWNIGGGKDAFIPLHYIQYIYASFPLFCEWLQGGLWVLFNDVRATSLINPIALAILCLSAWKWLGVRISWLLLASLAYPLIAIHMLSNYIDVFVGAMLATAAIAVTPMYVWLQAAPSFQKLPSEMRAPFLVFNLAILMAANSKIQAWLVALPFIFFIFVKFFRLIQGNTMRLRLTLYSIALVMACSYTPIANMVLFGNPLFPLIVKTNPLSVGLSPELGRYAFGFSSREATPDYAGHSLLSQPVYFLFSVSEIDWSVRHVIANYSILMPTGDRNGRLMRTGGLWGIMVGFHCALLAMLLSNKNTCRTLLPSQRFFLQCFGVMTLIIMFLPKSQELRYVFVWPFMLAIASGIYVQHTSFRMQTLLAMLLILFLAIGQIFLPMQRTIYGTGHMPATPHEWAASGSPEIIARLKDTPVLCINTPEVAGYIWFRYSRAIIGGTHTIMAPVDSDQPCNPDVPNKWLF